MKTFILRKRATGITRASVLIAAVCSLVPLAVSAAPSYPATPRNLESISVVKTSSSTSVVRTSKPQTKTVVVTVLTDSLDNPNDAFVSPVVSRLLGGNAATTARKTGGPNLSNTMPLAAQATGGAHLQRLLVPFTFAAGVRGKFTVRSTATGNFSADGATGPQTWTNVGDTCLSIGEEAPGRPGVQRFRAQVITNPLTQAPPGAQVITKFRTCNFDLTRAANVTVTVTSKQTGLLPPGGNGTGAFAFASPVTGEDFPIGFAEQMPAGALLPLPPNPNSFVQPPITWNITLPPDTSRTIPVAIRSFPTSGRFSACEVVFTVIGTYSNGDPIDVCVGGAHIVDAARSEPASEITALSPGSMQLTALEANNGVRAVQVHATHNATLAIPTFPMGTKAPVNVGISKTNPAQPAHARLALSTVGGATVIVDPVLLTLNGSLASPVKAFVGKLPRARSQLTIYNGGVGLQSLRIQVNGISFFLEDFELGEVRHFDVSSAMKDGDTNIMVFTPFSSVPGSAAVLIHE